MPLLLTELAADKPVKPLHRPTPGTERTEDGARVLVAVLAPVIPGWVVVPVSATRPCVVNHTNISAVQPILPDDVLVLGQKDFRVREASAEGDEPEMELAPDRCEVLARVHGREVARTTAARPLTVGTASDCGLVLPADSGLQPYHAVLAHYANRWHLFVLTGDGVIPMGSEKPIYSVPLVRNESVWLSQVELTVVYEEVDPLDLAYGAVIPAATSLARADTEDLTHETESGSEGSEGAPSDSSSSGNWRVTAVNAKRDNSLHLRGLGICQWLQSEHSRVPPQSRPNRITQKAFPLKRQELDGSLEELDRFSTKLQVNSWEPDLLFDLAGCLRRLGMSDSSRWVLKELYRQNPSDPVVSESLAVLTWEQSRDPLRPEEMQAADLKRAYKYITLATRLRPSDIRLAEVQRAIGSDLTLRHIGHSGTAVRRNEDD